MKTLGVDLPRTYIRHFQRSGALPSTQLQSVQFRSSLSRRPSQVSLSLSPLRPFIELQLQRSDAARFRPPLVPDCSLGVKEDRVGWWRDRAFAVRCVPCGISDCGFALEVASSEGDSRVHFVDTDVSVA